ncbi:hypothetical protein SELMODRAFT_444171 [Selaginella moellendorffii]|uniref:Uncharacterized protein n=1 Tax=Selaginella moellendorffii TaxID=88036 RepID=D8S7J3_SELML|nr:uncharacterized protein LOC9633861 [Selaginella moellendorffii]EFJ19619.1 hypothetical protein SELMODRAFT_444171 [Selaginella moellendorffii]|eukprot:XP_002979211.1 uncharacterized protein LOC9633861 [Selaginella moellendorffii]
MAKLGALAVFSSSLFFFFFFFALSLARELPRVPTHLCNNGTGEPHSKLKGESNYFSLRIYYTKGPLTLEVKNSWLNYGKWIRSTKDFTETKSPDGLKMKAWGEYHIYASGRRWSPSGTDGSFDIYASDGPKVVYVYWDVSYGGTAQYKQVTHDSRFKVTSTRIGESALDVTMVIRYNATEATEATGEAIA